MGEHPRLRVVHQQFLYFAKPKLLIVDELGYLPFERRAAHLMFQLVNRRYEKGSLMITSNQPVGAWGEVFGDTILATAILDRLLHHSHILTIKGREQPPARKMPSRDRPGQGQGGGPVNRPRGCALRSVF